MGLDIRLPIGMMFSLLGALLALYGLATGSDSGMYAHSLDINIDLWWGIVLFLFGASMLGFALKQRMSKTRSKKQAE